MRQALKVSVSLPPDLYKDIEDALAELGWGSFGGRSRFMQDAARRYLRELRVNGDISPAKKTA